MLSTTPRHCSFSKLLARRPSAAATDFSLTMQDNVTIINPTVDASTGTQTEKTDEGKKQVFRSLFDRLPTPYPEKKEWITDDESVDKVKTSTVSIPSPPPGGLSLLTRHAAIFWNSNVRASPVHSVSRLAPGAPPSFYDERYRTIDVYLEIGRDIYE